MFFSSDARPVRGLRFTSSLAQVTGCRLKTSARAFRHSAVAAWNSLPSTVAACETVGTFRKQLKTHLYDVAYKTVWAVAPRPRMASPHMACNKFYVLTTYLVLFPWLWHPGARTPLCAYCIVIIFNHQPLLIETVWMTRNIVAFRHHRLRASNAEWSPGGGNAKINCAKSTEWGAGEAVGRFNFPSTGECYIHTKTCKTIIA